MLLFIFSSCFLHLWILVRLSDIFHIIKLLHYYQTNSMSLQEKNKKVKMYTLLKRQWHGCFFLVLFCFVFVCFGGGCTCAYGSSKARGQMWAVAAGLHHSHSNTRSKLNLQPTPQLTATELRDWTHVLMDTSWVYYHWAMTMVWLFTSENHDILWRYEDECIMEDLKFCWYK